MLLVALASRKLADAVLSILIEWPPCYSSRVERSRRCARAVLRRSGQWAADWYAIMRRDFPEQHHHPPLAQLCPDRRPSGSWERKNGATGKCPAAVGESPTIRALWPTKLTPKQQS